MSEIAVTGIFGSKEFEKTVEDLKRENAEDLGKLAVEWNALHRVMGDIFALLVNPQQLRMGYAIWNAVQNDRSQRQMLKAVTLTVFTEETQFCRRVLWALGEAQTLEDARNNALHSPYMITIDAHQLRAIPYHHQGHYRANRLKGKHLRTEFQRATNNMTLLGNFIGELTRCQRFPELNKPLPKKPSLPAAVSTKDVPDGHRQSRRRVRPRPL